MTAYLIYILGVYFSMTQAYLEKYTPRNAVISAVVWPVSVPIFAISRLFKNVW